MKPAIIGKPSWPRLFGMILLIAAAPMQGSIADDVTDDYLAPEDLGAVVQMTPQTQYSPRGVTTRQVEVIPWKTVSQPAQTVTADPKLAKRAGSVVLPRGEKRRSPPASRALERPSRY